ncbi:MAG: NUDIX hydrolase [Oscillospiraceae bacterium]|nr:NUDIX hydrolase [Oscillospiraceae bacterium]
MEKKIRRAVGAVIRNDKDQFLLVHKVKVMDAEDGKKRRMDSLDLPKGGVKIGEGIEDAIRREVFEEVGAKEFAVIREIPARIRFDFPAELRSVIGFDSQETVMFEVFCGEDISSFRCVDDEIDGYRFVARDEMQDILTLPETKEFWQRFINE